MKRDTLKIGARSKSKRPQFEAQFTRPETLAECLKLTDGNELAVVQRFVRGFRIWLQDAVARPMFEAGASVADIQTAIDAAKLGVTKAVGRPKVTPTVAIPKDAKTLTVAQITELLAKQGIKLVSE